MVGRLQTRFPMFYHDRNAVLFDEVSERKVIAFLNFRFRAAVYSAIARTYEDSWREKKNRRKRAS